MFRKVINTPALTTDGTVSVTVPFGASKYMAEVVVTTTSGAVAVQPKITNDGTNYKNVGSALTATNRFVSLSDGDFVAKTVAATADFTSGSFVGSVAVTFYFE